MVGERPRRQHRRQRGRRRARAARWSTRSGQPAGEAVANTDDVADWSGAERLVQTAIDEFGTLHVLVNNAGILRDRMLANMSEAEFDDVMRVHLKGHFAPLRHAAAYWRDQAKAGTPVAASVINTSSTSGLFGNVGQTNYGAGEDRHRHDDDHRPDGARPVRRAVQRDRAVGDDPPDHDRARRRRAPAGAHRRVGPARSRATSRRSSPTSRPRTARSRAACSGSRAATSGSSSRSPSSTRSTPTTAGPSTSCRRRRRASPTSSSPLETAPW